MLYKLEEIEDFAKFWDDIEEKYPLEHDYLVALVRAFRDHKCDYVIINSRRQEYQYKSATFGLECKLLYAQEIDDYEDQYTELRFRLTELGKLIILHPESHNKYTL